MPTVNIQLERFRTKKQQKLLAMLNDKSVQKQCNEILKNYINKFVPMESGALRRSAIATHKSITWGRGLTYARYQYEGDIYGPNIPIIKGGKVIGWFSRPPKYNTGRKMTAYTYGNDLLNYHFGYNVPGTKHHWDEEFNKSIRWKNRANIDVTLYLKKECKDRGLDT